LQFFRPVQNRWRKELLGLPRFPVTGPHREIRRKVSTVMGYSSIVMSTPADWPASNHVTGYWFLDEAENWQPSAESVAFLEAKPTPIYIGFGSMPERDSARMTQLVLEVLRLSGQRCVLLGGSPEFRGEQLSDTVFHVESIPHAWLFRRVAAVVRITTVQELQPLDCVPVCLQSSRRTHPINSFGQLAFWASDRNRFLITNWRQRGWLG
jgi:UDP:flavonoid glycosyltransferase YjiC (YdhE family)